MRITRYARATEFVRQLPARQAPDCIVADIRMPGMSGMDLQRWLVSNGRSIPLILMTGYAEIGIAVAAMKAGAFDFLEKPIDERHLIASIKQAVTSAQQRHLEEKGRSLAAERIRALSDREQEVFWLTSRGRTSKEIGAELGISPRTVEIHRASVFEKTQCASLADLVRLAVGVEAMGEFAPKPPR